MPLKKGTFNGGIKNLIPAKPGQWPSPRHERSKTCRVCKKQYITKAANSVYCSLTCYKVGNLELKKQTVTKCEVCSSTIKYRRISGKNTRFCSQACAGINKTIFKGQKAYFYKALFFYGLICSLCSNANYKHLVVHHRNKNRSDNSLENLQVLCANCHFEIHYGAGSAREKRITNYLKILQRNEYAFKAWIKSKIG